MKVHDFGLYRRPERPAFEVPVVLPQVDVTIDDAGCVDVQLDKEPYTAAGALKRRDLQQVVAEIAAGLGTAVRVNVREADGTVFGDIITPPNQRLQDENDESPERPTTAGELTGAGFQSGEQVQVAVVVAREVADATGTARLRLPPALLAAHRGEIILIGEHSGIPTAR